MSDSLAGTKNFLGSPGAAARLLPQDKLILITDAMAATGMPDGEYKLGSVSAHVKEGVARTNSGSLAGSTLRMKDAVKNYAAWSGDLITALKAASTNPAEAYGIELPTLNAKNYLVF